MPGRLNQNLSVSYLREGRDFCFCVQHRSRGEFRQAEECFKCTILGNLEFVCEGWHSSGKIGISSLPREETGKLGKKLGS